jgi:hypothetical protein
VIKRNKDRIKQTGEVFTPLELVDEILAKLPEDNWKPTKTFLDNSCGDGNFLVRVIAHKIHKGSTPQQALKTTYGVDLMPDNVVHTKHRILVSTFAADVLRTNNTLLPRLTHDLESLWAADEEFKSFSKKYSKIVNKNIVCHDALTYDYNFD